MSEHSSWHSAHLVFLTGNNSRWFHAFPTVRSQTGKEIFTPYPFSVAPEDSQEKRGEGGPFCMAKMGCLTGKGVLFIYWLNFME